MFYVQHIVDGLETTASFDTISEARTYRRGITGPATILDQKRRIMPETLTEKEFNDAIKVWAYENTYALHDIDDLTIEQAHLCKAIERVYEIAFDHGQSNMKRRIREMIGVKSEEKEE